MTWENEWSQFQLSKWKLSGEPKAKLATIAGFLP
jgi:hypothetical protein